MHNLKKSIKVWDLGVRLSHIILIVSLVVLWWSGENRRFDIHIPAGLCLCGVVLFRIVWGVVGTRTARFKSFLRGPKHVLTYAQSHLHKTSGSSHYLGHNPIGGWSVALMLVAMATQLISGLFSVDVDGLESGFLSSYVSFDLGRAFADLHEAVFNVLLLLIGLHILAIGYYGLMRKQNLITPMITGKVHQEQDAPQLDSKPVSFGICVLIGVLATAFLFLQQY